MKGKSNANVAARNSREYVEQRKKNNISVRKSREKSKIRIMETKEKVDRLKKENVELVNQIELLNRELVFLKELFKTHFNAKHAGKDSATMASWCFTWIYGLIRVWSCIYFNAFLFIAMKDDFYHIFTGAGIS